MNFRFSLYLFCNWQGNFHGRRNTRVLQPLYIFENPCHRVVITGGNGVKLVIVTTRASDRLCQQACSNNIELLIDNIHIKLALVLVLKERVTHHQERRGDKILPLCVD